MFISLLLSIAFYSFPGSQVSDRTELVASELGTQVDAYLEECEALGFSGAVLVQKDKKVIVRKGYGKARWDTDAPNSPIMLYDIASASKQITAAAILLLESQGKLDTSASIAEYLPNVPKKHKDITVYHLLTHTSGFPRNGPSGSGQDMEKALEKYFQGERKSKGGKKFEYYNGGYAMLAMIVERVAKQKFEEWVDANLFKPIGMKHTYFAETMGMDEAFLSARYHSRDLTTNYIRGWGYRGMGGVVTSVADLAIWCNALFSGEVLPPEALEKMLTPYKDKYGGGWYIFTTDGGRKVIQHGGTSPGFQSYIRYFPEDDLLVLVLTNRAGWHWQVAWGIPGIVLNEPVNTPPLPETVELSKSKAAAFSGTWESKGRRIVVRQNENGFSIAPLDPDSKLALMGDEIHKPDKDSPKDSEVEASGKMGMDIISGLQLGDVSIIKRQMAGYIPKRWPDDILNDYWPKLLERWGKVEEQELLTAYYDPETKWNTVWVRLVMGKASRSVQICFFHDRIKILDLNAPEFPYLTTMVPIRDNILTSFDYQTTPPATLILSGKGKSRKLEMKSRNGEKIKFKLVGPGMIPKRNN
ncbi:MAG: beta-lactamase family protein [Planctomycetes bacterium]|nr:beta-lactamase family protein [Planctomycetota bacterium]